jgi:hypothetical protein
VAGTLTRRTFLARAGSLIAAAAIPIACGGKKTSASTAVSTGDSGSVPVYLLSTSDSKCTGTTCACGACQKHAANKLFASREAADSGRAHVHCNCTVVEGTLSPGRWQALFGDKTKPDRLHVDRRDASVARVLA